MWQYSAYHAVPWHFHFVSKEMITSFFIGFKNVLFNISCLDILTDDDSLKGIQGGLSNFLRSYNFYLKIRKYQNLIICFRNGNFVFFLLQLLT